MNVPKLRFVEFEYEWASKLISEIVDNFGGTALEEFVSESGTHKFISIGNYLKTGNYFDNGQRVVLNEKTSTKLLNENDLVMVLNDKTQAGDLIGSTILINESDKFIYNQRSERLVCKIQTVFPKFLWHLFNTQKFRKMVFSISQGGTQIYVNFPAVKKLNVSVPNIEEQQKIADFLSAVDEKITALAAQKTALTQYKQGMMQRIFSQTLRFKDDNGADYPEWEEYMIGDVFKVTRGQVLASSETSETVNSNYIYPVYSSQTKNNGLMGYFNDYLYQDAITWTTDGANAGDVNFRSGRFYCTNVCGVLISENGFANQCVSEILNKITHRYVSYVGNPKLMNNVMSNIVINLPSSIEEQTKIAQFLTECDDKINAVDAQIQSAQQWKQGLLQQMFV